MFCNYVFVLFSLKVDFGGLLKASCCELALWRTMVHLWYILASNAIQMNPMFISMALLAHRDVKSAWKIVVCISFSYHCSNLMTMGSLWYKQSVCYLTPNTTSPPLLSQGEPHGEGESPTILASKRGKQGPGRERLVTDEWKGGWNGVEKGRRAPKNPQNKQISVSGIQRATELGGKWQMKSDTWLIRNNVWAIEPMFLGVSPLSGTWLPCDLSLDSIKYWLNYCPSLPPSFSLNTTGTHLKISLPKAGVFFLSYPQSQAQHLTHDRSSIHIYWLNKT